MRTPIRRASIATALLALVVATSCVAEAELTPPASAPTETAPARRSVAHRAAPAKPPAASPTPKSKPEGLVIVDVPLTAAIKDAQATAEREGRPPQLYVSADENRRTIKSDTLPPGMNALSFVTPRPIRVFVDDEDRTFAVVKRGAAAGLPGPPEYLFYYLNNPSFRQTIEVRW